HNLELPALPSQGVLDSQAAAGQGAAIQQINQGLRQVAQEQSGVYVLDYDALVARHGRGCWHDERKWLSLRLPIAAPQLQHLARGGLRFIHPLSGKVSNAL